jgi:hypothetical protein
MPSKFYGRAVLEARMWADFVAVAAPGLDHDPRFVPGSEPLQAQAFVAQLPVEAFVPAVLPGLPVGS